MPALNIMGYISMEKGEMDQAKQAFEKAIKVAPHLANPLDSMGEYYMKVEEYDKAIEYFQKAYDKDPVNAASSKQKIEKAKEAQAGE